MPCPIGLDSSDYLDAVVVDIKFEHFPHVIGDSDLTPRIINRFDIYSVGIILKDAKHTIVMTESRKFFHKTATNRYLFDVPIQRPV